MDLRDQRVLHGVVAAAAAAVAWSGLFGYHRADRAFHLARHRLAEESARLARFEAMVQESGGATAWQFEQQQRLAQLERRFPSQPELPRLLDAMLDAVARGQVELRDVAQGNLEPVMANGQPLLIDDQPCHQLPVTVTLEGRYHAVLWALGQLVGEEFPAVVTMEEMAFRLQEGTGALVKATAHLRLYVVERPLDTAPDA